MRKHNDAFSFFSKPFILDVKWGFNFKNKLGIPKKLPKINKKKLAEIPKKLPEIPEKVPDYSQKDA